MVVVLRFSIRPIMRQELPWRQRVVKQQASECSASERTLFTSNHPNSSSLAKAGTLGRATYWLPGVPAFARDDGRLVLLESVVV